MILVIGGYAQGKLDYVLSKHEEQQDHLVNHMHLWFRELLQNGEDAEQVILDYCEEHPDCIFICDEIGNGIVPMDEMERTYRERLGRLLIELVKRADTVERVICGIGQKLK